MVHHFHQSGEVIELELLVLLELVVKGEFLQKLYNVRINMSTGNPRRGRRWRWRVWLGIVAYNDTRGDIIHVRKNGKMRKILKERGSDGKRTEDKSEIVRKNQLQTRRNLYKVFNGRTKNLETKKWGKSGNFFVDENPLFV
jgi:hypothetical protein